MENKFVKGFYIETKKSEKTGKVYTGLYADLGFTQQLLTCDRTILMLLSNLTAVDYMKNTSVEGYKINL